MIPPDAALTPFADALATVMAEAAALGVENIALAAASGRVLAQDLVAPFDLPRFDNTSVDGYAVHAVDIGRADREGSALLTLDLVIPAGTALLGRQLAAGSTARVLTGSPLPIGTAAVVMQEDVIEQHGHVRISAGISPGQCIRRQGEEFRCGDVVARASQSITPPLCALAATLGLTELRVGRAPRVGLLLTGSELVAPGQPLRDGQIYESNGAGLAAALRLAGIASLDQRTVADLPEATRSALAELLEANDVVVTSGGVSVGTHDTVKEALQQLGVERRLWRVAMKPGKPFYFGVRHRSGKKTAVFGLPGNPLSTLVTFSVFAFPYLRAIQGAAFGAQRFGATLATPLKKNGPRLEFVPVTLSLTERGWRAQPLDQRQSHMLGGFAKADALAVFPAEINQLAAGATIECQFLPWTAPRHA